MASDAASDQHDLRLEAGPSAVRNARAFAGEWATRWGYVSLADDVALVVTELVTNALLHAAEPITLRVRQLPDGVRVEVHDSSPVLPVLGAAGEDSMTGRGLSLVAALSRRVGVEQGARDKVVWAEVAAESEQPDLEREIEGLTERAATPAPHRYGVQIGDVPTDLLLAAKAHVDNLAREFTLAALGQASGETAGVPPELASLARTVVSDFAEARESIKRQALAAAAHHEPSTRLVVVLPPSAAAAGERYLAALDELDRYAEQARLLTLATPPEHRAFRHWYVETIVAALRAAAKGEPVPTAVPFEAYLRARAASERLEVS